MQKTTIYLPQSLKGQLARLASSKGVSEAQLIRETLSRMIESEAKSRPRIPLFASHDPTLAEHVDEALAGFGER